MDIGVDSYRSNLGFLVLVFQYSFRNSVCNLQQTTTLNPLFLQTFPRCMCFFCTTHLAHTDSLIYTPPPPPRRNSRKWKSRFSPSSCHCLHLLYPHSFIFLSVSFVSGTHSDLTLCVLYEHVKCSSTIYLTTFQ
jgi:hypothetical protein